MSLRRASASPPTQLTFFRLLFLIRSFQLIILLPSSCATADDRRSAGTDKNEKRPAGGGGNATDELREVEGGFAPTELERLSYSIADAYLPVWFERCTGWEGRTYEDAMRFCWSHNDFVLMSGASGALVRPPRHVVFSEAAQDTCAGGGSPPLTPCIHTGH